MLNTLLLARYARRNSALFFRDYTLGALNAGDTYSRASAATALKSSGSLQSYASNAPRLDPSYGLLIEPQATNKLYKSAIALTGAGVLTANGTLGPDGVALNSLYDTATTNRFTVEGAITNSTSGDFIVSCFKKQGSLRYLQLRLNDGTNNTYVIADLQMATIQTYVNNSGVVMTYGIIPCAGGWYRVWIKLAAVAAKSWWISVGLSNSATPTLHWSGSPQYAGTGSGYASYYGLSAVNESNLSSYIDAPSAATTRAADVLTFTIPSGINYLTYTFDDNSTQKVAASAGSYTVPTTLNRRWIKTIVGSAS